MQIRYFSTAWNDIKNSPGWFGKVLVLALVALIPVFGMIVVFGYLFGWARDKAWGVHAPLPEQIFGNEDGKLYSRGFFALVIALVSGLIPWIVEVVSNIVTGGHVGSAWFLHSGSPLLMPVGVFSIVGKFAFFALSIAASVAAAFFLWVGTMRMSIYGRLSAGFQLGKIWSMIRYDFNGILRILGMSILLTIGIVILITMLVVILSLGFGLLAAIFMGGAAAGSAPSGYQIFGIISSFGFFGFLFALAICFVAFAIVIWAEMVIVRALGYWVFQFNVAAWRGQDDPMPFELTGPAGGPVQQPPYQQPPSQ